jgi:hypothetical protein
MPIYIKRTLSEYPKEFYKSDANPEGFEFACYFCEAFSKTNSGSMRHMEQCCNTQGIEYDDNMEVAEGLTLYVVKRNRAIISTTVKNYITNNKLETETSKTPNQIQSRIQTELIENGFDGESLYEASFNIYKFFFEVTEDEWKEWIEKCTNDFCAKYAF